MKRKNIVNKIIEDVVIAVIRLEHPNQLFSVVQVIYDGYISLIEITMTSPNALEMIKILDNKFSGNIFIGVSSILNRQ